MKYYDPLEVGKRIRSVRKKTGVTQIKLAEELYISREMLSRIENGKSICGLDLMLYLRQRFDKTVDYFCFGEDYGNESKTRLEIINELKTIMYDVEMKLLFRIYEIVKIQTKNRKLA